MCENTFLMRTTFEALKLCLPVTFMSFAIFLRSDMVVTPGWPQIVDTLLVTIATCGITFAMFGRFTLNQGANIILRAALALAAMVVMFHPDGTVALVVGLVVGLVVAPVTILGVRQHRIIAPPKMGLEPQPGTAG